MRLFVNAGLGVGTRFQGRRATLRSRVHGRLCKVTAHRWHQMICYMFGKINALHDQHNHRIFPRLQRVPNNWRFALLLTRNMPGVCMCCNTVWVYATRSVHIGGLLFLGRHCCSSGDTVVPRSPRKPLMMHDWHSPVLCCKLARCHALCVALPRVACDFQCVTSSVRYPEVQSSALTS